MIGVDLNSIPLRWSDSIQTLFLYNLNSRGPAFVICKKKNPRIRYVVGKTCGRFRHDLM